MPKDIPSDQPPVWKNAEEAERNESDNDDDARQDKGESYDFKSDKPLKGMGVLDPLGVGGGGGGDYGGPRGGLKNTVSKRGGDKLTEGGVKWGLYWLAKHQNPNGSWGVKSFQNQCKAGNTCGGAGTVDFDLGVTGAALLAFTGATYSPGSISARDTFGGIRFGDTVRKAAQYLKTIQNADGTFGPTSQPKFMYNQATCTYAMCDLVALMKDKGEIAAVGQYEDVAKKAIQYLIDAQNPGKAWRYTAKCGNSDASVTGWCAMALKAAEEAKIIKVPESVWAGVKSYLDDATDASYGMVGYIDKYPSVAITPDEADRFQKNDMYIAPSLTGVGIMCRIFMGEGKGGVVQLGASVLTGADNLPKWDPSKYGKIDYYYWFYGSYSMNQFDGPTGPLWTKWNTEMKNVLLKSQRQGKEAGCANGSWDPCDRWGHEAGRVYSTAIATLTLEVYYRLRIVMGK
jgi:hypothetical protein